MDRLRFTKIKFGKGRVRLEYERPRGDGDPDIFTLECNEAPQPDFVRALESLREPALEICELASGLAPRLAIHGLSLSYAKNAEDEEVRGATISGLLTLNRSRSPLVLNTPHKPETPYSGEEHDDYCLSSDTVDAIDALIRQAEKYLSGSRAQGTLLLDEGAAPATGASAAGDPSPETPAKAGKKPGSRRKVLTTAAEPPSHPIDGLMKHAQAAVSDAERTIDEVPTKVLRSMKKLCPDGKPGGLTSVEFSIPGGRSVTLTAETQKNIEAALKHHKD